MFVLGAFTGVLLVVLVLWFSAYWQSRPQPHRFRDNYYDFYLANPDVEMYENAVWPRQITEEILVTTWDSGVPNKYRYKKNVNGTYIAKGDTNLVKGDSDMDKREYYLIAGALENAILAIDSVFSGTANEQELVNNEDFFPALRKAIKERLTEKQLENFLYTVNIVAGPT